jgi:hypothetical protein
VVEEEGTGSFGERFLEGTGVMETGGARVVETGGADGCETREAGVVETGGADGRERGETTVVEEEEEEETGNLGGRNTLGVSVVEMGKTDG